MALRQNASRPLFKFSQTGIALLFLVGFLFSLWLIVNEYAAKEIGLEIVDSTVAVFLLFGFVSSALIGIRTAYFYDDRANLIGFGFKRELNYSLIDKVLKVKVLDIQRTQVHIYSSGKTKPYVIRGNPTNGKLKTDLYTWLNGNGEGIVSTAEIHTGSIPPTPNRDQSQICEGGRNSSNTLWAV